MFRFERDRHVRIKSPRFQAIGMQKVHSTGQALKILPCYLFLRPPAKMCAPDDLTMMIPCAKRISEIWLCSNCILPEEIGQLFIKKLVEKYYLFERCSYGYNIYTLKNAATHPMGVPPTVVFNPDSYRDGGSEK